MLDNAKPTHPQQVSIFKDRILGDLIADLERALDDVEAAGHRARKRARWYEASRAIDAAIVLLRDLRIGRVQS